MSKRTTTLILVAGLLSVVAIGAVVFARTTGAQTQSADKPIEQTRKNIQVLKGLRESELYRVMNFMAVSVGKECDFCHVFNGQDLKTGQRNWVWECDEKPEKQA